MEDMRRALLAEFGAQAIYRQLAARVDQPELKKLLEQLHIDEAGQIARLSEVMRSLGETPKERSQRRQMLAWSLVVASRLTGNRLVLRICLEAESTASRWYAQFHAYFSALGERELAHTCGEMSLFKLRRAHALQPWLDQPRRASR